MSDASRPDPGLVPGEYDLNAILPYAVVRAGVTLERAFAAAMAREDLTPRHFGILFQFTGGRTTTAAEIARALDVTPQSIGPHVDALQARGLITRTPRAGRGRPNELRLTDDGTATLERALVLARAAQARLTGELTPAEQRTMLGQLEGMVERAHQPPSEWAGARPRSTAPGEDADRIS